MQRDSLSTVAYRTKLLKEKIKMHGSQMEGQSLETVEPIHIYFLRKTISHGHVYKCVEKIITKKENYYRGRHFKIVYERNRKINSWDIELGCGNLKLILPILSLIFKIFIEFMSFVQVSYEYMNENIYTWQCKNASRTTTISKLYLKQTLQNWTH